MAAQKRGLPACGLGVPVVDCGSGTPAVLGVESQTGRSGSFLPRASGKVTGTASVDV